MKKMIIVLVSMMGILNAGVNLTFENENFAEIKNSHRQAEAWATCNVVYDAISVIVSNEDKSNAKLLHQKANGAKIGILMVHVYDSFEDISTFKSQYKYGQEAIDNLIEIKRTQFEAELSNAIKNKQTNELEQELLKAMRICEKNSELQQMYIDTWRDMFKKGILKN